MHACDGQTDGRTDRQTDRNLLAIPRLHYMQRGKNCLTTANLQTKESTIKEEFILLQFILLSLQLLWRLVDIVIKFVRCVMLFSVNDCKTL